MEAWAEGRGISNRSYAEFLLAPAGVLAPAPGSRYGRSRSYAADAGALRVNQVVAIDSDEGINGLPELDAIADTVDQGVIDKLLRKLKHGGVLRSVLGGAPTHRQADSFPNSGFQARQNGLRIKQNYQSTRDLLTVYFLKENDRVS